MDKKILTDKQVIEQEVRRARKYYIYLREYAKVTLALKKGVFNVECPNIYVDDDDKKIRIY